MIRPSLPLLIAASLALPAAALAYERAQSSSRTPAPPPPRIVTSITIQRSLIIRVPRLPIGATPLASVSPLPPIRWTEKRADRCVPVTDLAGAAISTPDSVDLLLNGGKRLRARFDDNCPALDFYSGFYVKMPRDGKVCARRDTVRSRSGGECTIASFRALVPTR